MIARKQVIVVQTALKASLDILSGASVIMVMLTVTITSPTSEDAFKYGSSIFNTMRQTLPVVRRVDCRFHRAEGGVLLQSNFSPTVDAALPLRDHYATPQ